MLEAGKVDYRDSLTFPPVTVDRVIGDGERVVVGQSAMTAHVTPGHTKGCTSWSARALRDGQPLDIFFSCSLTVAGQDLVDDKGLSLSGRRFHRDLREAQGTEG